jgi:MFS family permease
MQTEDFIVKRIPSRFRPYAVVAAGVVLQFTFGITYTFGNILPYLVSYLRWKVDPSQTSGSMIWLQSLTSGIGFAMLAGGYLERRIGARLGAALGSVIYTGFLAVSYFSIQHSYYLLLLSFGMFASFGQGLAYNCVLIQCQKWFPNNIGMVSGLVTAGFGSGAFLIAPIQTKFINPDNFQVNQQGYFTQTELLERVPHMFLLLAGIFGVLQFVALFFIAEPNESEGEDATSLISGDVLLETDTPSYRAVVTSSTFYLLFFTLLLNGIWIQTTTGLFKTFGQQFIADDFFLAMVNSMAALTNCFSRVFWGIIADRSSYQTSMGIACAVAAALMWTLSAVKFFAGRVLFLLWICGMFSCIGATFSLLPYAVHHCFGQGNFGIIYGSIQVALTFSGIITALSSQFLLPLIGFEWLFLLTGVLMAISMVLTRCIHLTEHGAGKESITGIL